MTLSDPVSIENGCVNTRGRDRKNQSAEMFPKILFCLTLCLQSFCSGFPEGSIPIETASTATETSVPAILSKDESSILFSDIPQHIETPLGSSVLLTCRTVEPVIDCQWSWRPLPPIHLPLPDINNPEEINQTTGIATVSPTATTQSLPVRQFPAFGNNSNDCSVRFTNTQHEQTGYWTCAVRKSGNDNFFSTEPAKLTISNGRDETTIKFVQTDVTEEASVGSPAQLICRTETPVKDCQWSWRLFNQTEIRNLEVKKFPSFGIDHTDCSIKFKNVLSEQEGVWTCGARSNPNGTFVLANPIRFFVSEVEFVQISSGIQIAPGESALLKCLVDKPVVQCEWSWKPINSSKEPTVIKKFTNTDNDHDCSVRFKNVLFEEEGLWTCGVRLTNKGQLHEAPPAVLTLLPSAKISFAETPENNTIMVNTREVLKCTTTGRVDNCLWLWRPLDGDAEPTIAREFPGNGNAANGKNCTLIFPQVRIQDQGYWACRVSVASSNAASVLTSPFAKLVVYDQDKIEFKEISSDIQISSGGSVLLICVTSLSVEQCRWSLTPANSNTTVVVKQFPAVGPESRDCSVRLSHALAEQEGLWTCGAKVRGNETYTYAPPAKLSLLESDPVAVAVWASPHQKVTLACKLNQAPRNSKCEWIHESDDESRKNETLRKRQDLQMNYTTGLCTLQFKPDASDLGSWICKFNIDTGDQFIELGNASLVLIKTEPVDKMLGWIVGAVTTLILFSMILAVVLVVYKGKLFKKGPRVFETVSFDHQNNMNDLTRSNNAAVPKNEPRLTDEVTSGTNSHFYDPHRQYHSPTSKIFETFTTS